MIDKRTAASGKYLTGLNSVCQKFYSVGLKNIGGALYKFKLSADKK